MGSPTTAQSTHWRQRLTNWLDTFVPADVQRQPDRAQRARLLVGFSLTVAIVAVPPPVLSTVLHGRTPAAGIPLVLAIFCICIPLMLKRTGAVEVLGMALCLAGLVTTATVAQIDGGLKSHAIIWFPFATLIAAYLAGVRSAIALTVATLALLPVLYWTSAKVAAGPSEVARLQVRLLSTMSAAAFGWAMGTVAEVGRRRYLSELARAQERTQTLLNLLPDAALHLDATDRIITTVLPERARIGLADIDPQGRHIDDVLDPELASAFRAWRESGVVPAHPIELLEGDDRRYVTVQPISLAEGESVVILRDLTERAKMDQTKDDFVATVSHELRTPLTAINASLRLLEQGATGDLTAETRAMVALACRNSDRLASVIDDILDFQRIESGELSYHYDVVSTADLLRNAVELNQQTPKAAGVTLSIDPSTDAGLLVRADPSRIQQVLANLLSNAVRHSPPGSEVVLSAAPSGAQARLEVRDQGTGIPLDFQDRVFERFAQAPRPRGAGQSGGTGLGLAISKRIVEDHGGTIGFVSDPSGGTTFWVLLDQASLGEVREGA